MNRQMLRAGVLALGLVAAGTAWAQSGSENTQRGPGYGPGMMGGYGPGWGWGGGYGPGMMGGYGPGPGMMRGYGYGPGPGMMGWYGPGWGGNAASGGASAPLAALNLTDQQREKILDIQEQNRRKNWDTLGKVRAEQFKLRSMYNSDNVDPQAFAEQQKKVDDIRRDLIVSRLETRKQIEAVLTPEQRQKFRQYGPGWMEQSPLE